MNSSAKDVVLGVSVIAFMSICCITALATILDGIIWMLTRESYLYKVFPTDCMWQDSLGCSEGSFAQDVQCMGVVSIVFLVVSAVVYCAKK